jgi:hypothetical protein
VEGFADFADPVYILFALGYLAEGRMTYCPAVVNIVYTEFLVYPDGMGEPGTMTCSFAMRTVSAAAMATAVCSCLWIAVCHRTVL